MMTRRSFIIMQNLVEIERRTSAWEDEVWCFSLFLFVCHTVARRRFPYIADCLQQDIVSAFVGRFRWSLQWFFGEENRFLADGTDLKIVAKWRYNWCPNNQENFQNLRKLVQSLCAPLRPFRSEMKENFYSTLYIIDVHLYKIFR